MGKRGKPIDSRTTENPTLSLAQPTPQPSTLPSVDKIVLDSSLATASSKKKPVAKLNQNLFESKSLIPDFDENIILLPTTDKILGDQDLLDLASARENPKLAAMVKNIDLLVGNLQVVISLSLIFF